MTLTDNQQSEMLEAAKPLIQWLNENTDPHCQAHVECTGVTLLQGVASAKTHEFLKDYHPLAVQWNEKSAQARTDAFGHRWHKLTAVAAGERETEVLAATCIDGIGVIVRWVWFPKGQTYDVSILDTENGEWEPLAATDLEEGIPMTPPTVWDDKS